MTADVLYEVVEAGKKLAPESAPGNWYGSEYMLVCTSLGLPSTTAIVRH